MGGIAMKGYSTFPKSPELEPDHQMQFSVLSGTYFWFLLFSVGGGLMYSKTTGQECEYDMYGAMLTRVQILD